MLANGRLKMQSKVGLSGLSSRGNSGAWCWFSESGHIRERLKTDDGEKREVEHEENGVSSQTR